MKPDSIVEARIHPAIGVARVGNSEEYFLGPEVPNRTPAPAGGYRDGEGRLKRQAARFRIYGYDKDGQVVGEITDSFAEIEWTVEVANKKPAWYNFDVALDIPQARGVRSPRRNSAVQGAERSKLAIVPGPRRVGGRTAPSALFDTGTFFDLPVYLGEIRHEAEGRLLFVPGRGKSGPASKEFSISDFANNPGWYDDVADGPVDATVRIRDRVIPVEGAWVVSAPPNYAPDLVASQTLYDVIVAASGQMMTRKARPSFTEDILPVFRQFQDAQWVNAGFAALFGWGGLHDFNRDNLIGKLAAAVSGPNNDPYAGLRQQVFRQFRDPSSSAFEPLRWPPLYGDAFFFQDDPPSANVALSITRLSYSYLQAWMLGNFDADYNPLARDPETVDDLPMAKRPAALDRAALHFCIGGPFHPGCEMTWNIRHASMYRSPFRLRRRLAGLPEPDYGDSLTPETALAQGGMLSASGPGDVTKWLAVPWQTDTASCRAGYRGTEFPADDQIPAFWPSRVPNSVLDEKDYEVILQNPHDPAAQARAFHTRVPFLKPLNLDAPFLSQLEKMVESFDELGVLERREAEAGPQLPKVMYVQTSARGAADGAAPPLPQARQPEIQPILKLRRRRSDSRRRD
jgi:hypothetical protein